VEKAPGRRTNVGRKAEATDQFQPPRCGLCVMKLCAPGPYALRGPAKSCPMGSRRIPKVDKRRTEGGTDRPILATSLEIYWI
jgi:hypothetical protein